MKLHSCGRRIAVALVAPLVGVWIEIMQDGLDAMEIPVAPLAEAWIEIIKAAMNWKQVDATPPYGNTV